LTLLSTLQLSQPAAVLLGDDDSAAAAAAAVAAAVARADRSDARLSPSVFASITDMMAPLRRRSGTGACVATTLLTILDEIWLISAMPASAGAIAAAN
jgi:hypothetical protein